MAEFPAEPTASMLKVWEDVAAGMEKTKTVVWKSAVTSLRYAHHYLLVSKEAREFAEQIMSPMITILLDQHSNKIGQEERHCIQESILYAIAIVAKDLGVQIQAKKECKYLPTLEIVLDKSKMYYKGVKASWHSGSPGVPEARYAAIDRFRKLKGFSLLAEYLAMVTALTTTAPTTSEMSATLPGLDETAAEAIPPPQLTLLNCVVIALYDSIKIMPPRNGSPNLMANHQEQMRLAQADAIQFGQAVMQYIQSASDDSLKKLSTDQLGNLQLDMQSMFDQFVYIAKGVHRPATMAFYKYWRDFVWKLLSSGSLPLKLFGWEQLSDLLDACAAQRPPPRNYMVTEAGFELCNGLYEYSGPVTDDGYSVPSEDVKYVHKVPPSVLAAAADARAKEIDASSTSQPPFMGGMGSVRPRIPKKLTIFRCTMRSTQKWWFLSEADELQPGTDKDVDYYQHKSRASEEGQPPSRGWITCKETGIDPPPVLEARGLMVPPGEEYNTLEHQLAKWAIENEIVEQVLGDTTIHREVVARSTVLIKFLASMCDRYPPPSMTDCGPTPTKYCLLSSHLLYAWKTCLRKADAAVSSQVYHLLVSVLPLCPADLANPLLQAIQESLEDGDEENHLFEVSEFCSALASGIQDAKAGGVPLLKDDVREEVLNLLWSVLRHPTASSLRSYDTLKRYVTHELQVEPSGREHRVKLVRACYDAFVFSAKTTSPRVVNEVELLRIVDLIKFVLDACPRGQAVEIVTCDNGDLPLVLFKELTAYLKRKQMEGFGFCDSSSAFHRGTAQEDAKLPLHALRERLRILRYVYGIGDHSSRSKQPPTLNSSMLKELWGLCNAPDDREALMVFIAGASHESKLAQVDPVLSRTSSQEHALSEYVLNAAFTPEVALTVFLDLFCSETLDFEYLGEAAFTSFRSLLASSNICLAAGVSPDTTIVIEALWRICLIVGNDDVASLAMQDLLGLYISIASFQTDSNEVTVSDRFGDFRKRVFQCLILVKQQLQTNSRTANRSTGRCLRILKAAVGQSDFEGHSVCSSTLSRLETLPQTATLDSVMASIPHGFRGRGCYRRVGIQAKRAQGLSHVPDRPATVKFSLDLHPLETLASVKQKVSRHCKCPLSFVKPIQISGRALRQAGPDLQPNNMSLNLVAEDTSVDDLGIVEGCELILVIAEPRVSSNASMASPIVSRRVRSHDLTDVFFENKGDFSEQLFQVLMDVSKLIPWREGSASSNGEGNAAVSPDAHVLVWDILLAMPTNILISAEVKSAASPSFADTSGVDSMDVESGAASWSNLLDSSDFDRSVYVLLTIDALLRPAREVLSVLQPPRQEQLSQVMTDEALMFRRSFLQAGGFQHIARFFSAAGNADKSQRSKTRRGNAVALRILKSCLFGDERPVDDARDDALDELGRNLLTSLSDVHGLLTSLLAMVIDDAGISSSAISDVLRFLSLLFQSPSSSESFRALPDDKWEKFLIKSLTHEEDSQKTCSNSSISAAMHVRRSAHDLILQADVFADSAVPWLTKAIAAIDVSSESSEECFDVVEKLVSDKAARCRRSRDSNDRYLEELFAVVCQKLVACPVPKSESEAFDVSTAVLCGCLKLIRAIIECSKGLLGSGVSYLQTATGASGWAGESKDDEDRMLVDLMGLIMDFFLSPVGGSSVAVCCDRESRRLGFDAVEAAARSCSTGNGYRELVSHIDALVAVAAPKLKDRWGQFGTSSTETNSKSRSTSKYSGLKNAGCTCYMNSVLQQLFMMSDIRDSLCSVRLPAALRTSGDAALSGFKLVGKKIALHWESGVTYDAVVESFDESSGAHCIRYCPIYAATTGPGQHNKTDLRDVSNLPPNLPDEFVLSDGRPGKETGAYDTLPESTVIETESAPILDEQTMVAEDKLRESDDERASRRLLEEVQRTFIHLDKGARGRHFDPKALVEACTCLKLEFDVWQQNDASEFTTKLLDRLEISLKKWAPAHFQYLDHMFGIKQIKQKICRECGMKTNREEKLLNIDCQIRGKSDIREALATFTETEIMEGSNQVFCETCGKNTDTVLRTAISTLPNMLILSLKRFDLDFTTFETVKLNSRCAFGHTLNMKGYTLEGLEAEEKEASAAELPIPMETEINGGGSDVVLDQECFQREDDDYEYRLAGVLVHAGVAQGGHYYSFIRERQPGTDSNWFRFDDEDVTPFDPANIEAECFGGRVRKETKWPNGQVHTVEQEQFANALMLFYEKVKPSDPPGDESREADDMQCVRSSGYEVFEADVRQSNAAYKWQAFLFDSEFQFFLKRLLGYCVVPSPTGVTSSVTREPLLQTVLGYFFDVMPYSADHGHVQDWVKTLEQALYADTVGARCFVHELARKTAQVSSNWFRTFLLDCPDQTMRAGAVRVFAAGIRSCLIVHAERIELAAWAVAWEEQIQFLRTEADQAVPPNLTHRWASHEKIEMLAQSGSSGVGILISFLNVIIDTLHRCWRPYSDALHLIRLCAATVDNDFVLRHPLIAGLLPMRLIALTAREQLLPPDLRAAFPGASLPPELANTQIRAESSHSNVVSMGGNQMHGQDAGQRCPGLDYACIIEGLALMASLPGALTAVLVVDSGEMVRGRRRYILTEAATLALTAVFQEHCAPGCDSMSPRELENFINRCGMESSQGISQRVAEMMKPSSPNENMQGLANLTLSGFLSFYRDTVQSNDLHLRADLHQFGFRPDLSRRSQNARMVQLLDGVVGYREPGESIAIDVAEVFGESAMNLGAMVDSAINNTLSLLDYAFRYSEVHALYLLAGASYKRDSTELIHRLLIAISTSSTDWQGNERVTFYSQALKVIASVPDQGQITRIGLIMESSLRPRNADYGIGLLSVLQCLKQAMLSPLYNRHTVPWIFNRYIAILKSLRKLCSVHQWMHANKQSWEFIERDLIDDRTGAYNQAYHIRNDFTSRDDARLYVPQEVDDRNMNDMDVADMDEESDDDDDSRFDDDQLLDGGMANYDHDGTMYQSSGSFEIEVLDAGSPEVNGIYQQNGLFQGARQYSRIATYEGHEVTFAIFICSVSNNSLHWYISIIPPNSTPGTSADTDFYTAQAGDCLTIPPLVGWGSTGVGRMPAPLLTYRDAPLPIDEDETSAYGLYSAGATGGRDRGGGPSVA